MTADSMAGQAVIVTGGGQGLGRAFATRFAAEGLSVLVADIRHEAADAVAAEITAAGGTARAIHVDVTDASSGRAMCDLMQQNNLRDALTRQLAAGIVSIYTAQR